MPCVIDEHGFVQPGAGLCALAGWLVRFESRSSCPLCLCCCRIFERNESGRSTGSAVSLVRGRHALDLEAGATEWRGYDDMYPDSEGEGRSVEDRRGPGRRGKRRWSWFTSVLNPHSRPVKVSGLFYYTEA